MRAPGTRRVRSLRCVAAAALAVRWTMAVWLVRALDGEDPDPVSSTRFADVDGTHRYAAFIERFAELGVTAGCKTDPLRYCPDDTVTRAQMATFLVRAFDLEDAAPAGFADTADNTHAADIDKLAAARVTAGCATDPLRYCPNNPVTRAQMATFLARAQGPTGHLWTEVSSGSGASIAPGKPFEVTVEFARAVSGLAEDDIQVVNGDIEHLAGSDSRYRATVRAAAPGTVMVRIPKGAAQDRRGNSNSASQPLAITAYTGRSPQTIGIDTWDRDAVLAAYTAEFDRLEPDLGFTGDVDDCEAGSTSQQFRNSVIQRVNWYRQMAGLHPVTENQDSSKLAQHAALMMSAQGGLSHYPGTDWACFRAEGAAGAGSSNLSLGVSGVNAIDGYIQDPGPANVHVGHRHWILYPKLTTMGTGDIPHRSQRGWPANALYVTNVDWSLPGEVREERGFVAWPPPGFVPPEVNWTRWSFSLEDADFSAASVEVADDSGTIEAAVINRDRFVTEAIVWAMDGASDSYLLATGANEDHCYTVTIVGVRINSTARAPYEYAVCVIDMDS